MFEGTTKTSEVEMLQEIIDEDTSLEEYVSIIHITSRCDEATNNRILSSKESADIISGLSETPIAPVVYKVEELLNNSLKDDIDEE